MACCDLLSFLVIRSQPLFLRYYLFVFVVAAACLLFFVVMSSRSLLFVVICCDLLLLVVICCYSLQFVIILYYSVIFVSICNLFIVALYDVLLFDNLRCPSLFFATLHDLLLSITTC